MARKPPDKEQFAEGLKVNLDTVNDWIIVYDDAAVGNETFRSTGAVALKRLAEASLNWNCHLFMRVLSV